MEKYTWQEAMDFTKGLNFAGKTDWRLPSREELLSLVDISQSAPALPEGHPFLYVQAYDYWSSSSYASSTYSAWYVYMGDGVVDFSYKNYDDFYVWPVRNGVKVDCSERFTDNFDGTVNDNTTGLCWIKDLQKLVDKEHAKM